MFRLALEQVPVPNRIFFKNETRQFPFMLCYSLAWPCLKEMTSPFNQFMPVKRWPVLWIEEGVLAASITTFRVLRANQNIWIQALGSLEQLKMRQFFRHTGKNLPPTYIFFSSERNCNPHSKRDFSLTPFLWRKLFCWYQKLFFFSRERSQKVITPTHIWREYFPDIFQQKEAIFHNWRQHNVTFLPTFLYSGNKLDTVPENLDSISEKEDDVRSDCDNREVSL